MSWGKVACNRKGRMGQGSREDTKREKKEAELYGDGESSERLGMKWN